MQHESEPKAAATAIASLLFNSSNLTNSTAPFIFESCDKNSPYTADERILYASLGAVLCLLMTVTNLLLFIIFVTDSLVSRAPGHIIIVGMMVVADIMIGLIPLPGYLIYTLCGGWPLPKFMCDVWITMDYLATNGSYLSITTVAFERFIAVFFVLRHKVWMTQKTQLKLVISLWVFTAGRIILQFPLWAYVSEFRQKEAYGSCDHPLYHNVAIGLVQRSIALYIPVILTFTFYSAIVFKLFRTRALMMHERSIQKRHKHGNHDSEKNGCAEASPTTTNSAQQNDVSGSTLLIKSNTAPLNKSKSASYSKSVRVVSLVVLAFLLANLPWHIVENLRVTGQIVVKASDPIYVATWILSYMNGILNPPIYFFMNRCYRKAAIRFIRCQSVRTQTRKEQQRRYNNYQLELKRQGRGGTGRQNAITLSSEAQYEHDEMEQCTEFAVVCDGRSPDLSTLRRASM